MGLGAEWLRHRATFATDVQFDRLQGAKRDAPPPELHQLLGSDSRLDEEQFWLPEHGWDLEGILDDLRVKKGLLSEPPAKVKRRRKCAPVEPAIAVAQRWPLKRARDALPELIPELLQRAAK